MNYFSHFGQQPRGLFNIKTNLGERLRKFITNRPDRNFTFGINFRYGIFADHRSGSSAIFLDVCLGFWKFSPILFYWESPICEPVKYLTLREVFEREHGKHKFVREVIEEDQKND